jgi:hypothetical protein
MDNLTPSEIEELRELSVKVTNEHLRECPECWATGQLVSGEEHHADSNSLSTAITLAFDSYLKAQP